MARARGRGAAATTRPASLSELAAGGVPLPDTRLEDQGLLAVTTLAFLVSVLATFLMIRLAPRLGLMDRANPRSSHVGEVARGGGLGVILGTAAGLGLSGVGCLRGCVAILFGTLVLTVVGLWDDRWGVPPVARLAIHTFVATAVALLLGGLARLPLPPPLDVPLGAAGTAVAAVWIVAVVNFYNFLDGIDGLAGVQAVATGTGIALAAWDSFAALLGAGLAAASLGFLVHNWSPARIFLGDVGSGVLGFGLASAPLLAPMGVRPAAVFFVGLSLFLFLADATFTLVARARRGERLHEAHRQHLYQRLVAGGWSHARAAALLGAGAIVLTGAAFLAWRRAEPDWAWAALVLAAMGFGAELTLARRAGLGPMAGAGVRP